MGLGGAWLLNAYSYDIELRRTNEHSYADALSRLPLPVQPPSSTEATFVIGQFQALPVTVDCLVKSTRQDPVLSQVLQNVENGWRAKTPKEYKPFYSKKQELLIKGQPFLPQYDPCCD